jgi:hypothetical protein
MQTFCIDINKTTMMFDVLTTILPHQHPMKFSTPFFACSLFSSAFSACHSKAILASSSFSVHLIKSAT